MSPVSLLRALAYPVRRAPLVAFLALAAVPCAGQTRLWFDQFGSDKYDEALAVCPDGLQTGAFVGGYTRGDYGGPLAGIDGYSDAFLTRYDNAGSPVWVRQFGTDKPDYLRGLCTDSSGYVYSAGNTAGSLGGPYKGSDDAWLARHDSLGNLLWSRQIGTSSYDLAQAVASDGVQGAYVAGITSGSLAGPNAGDRDIWLARYDQAGSQLWIQQIGTAEWDDLAAAAPDGAGGVYVLGSTRGSLGATNLGISDVWLARYDANGNQTWIRQFGTPANDTGAGLSPDGLGGVYACGGTYAALGGAHAGKTDAWVARYDSGGNQQWISQIGSAYGESAACVARAGPDTVFVGGQTDSDLGGPWQGGLDLLVAQVDGGTGSTTWIEQHGGPSFDGTLALAPDEAGGVFAAGLCEGDLGLGGTPVGSRDAWLARYGGCPTPATYCTAKVNSKGCLPTIWYTGSPSASHATAFRIRASNVVSSSPGMLIYSKAGADAKPFQGGFLCVRPPIKRTSLQNSGGSPPPKDCSGTFVFEFNDLIASGQDPELTEGQQVWTQYWYRDADSPSGTGLTDGLHFTICP